MWDEIKKIIRHSSVYGLAILLTNFMGVILLPLYMNYLLPDELGLLEIINRTNDVLRIVLMVGLVTTTLRFYQDRDDEVYKKTVVSTSMQFLAVFAFVILSALMLFAKPLSVLMFASPLYVNYVRITLMTLFFEVLFVVPIVYFQARLQSTTYIIISLLRFVIGVILISYLVAYRHLGVLGVLYGQMIYVVAFSVVLYGWILVKVGLKFDLGLLRSMLKFGLPFVPGSLFLFILNSGDRYVLLHLTSAKAVGIYAIGYRIGNLVTALVMSPFMRVWSAMYVQYSRRENKDYLFANFMTYVIFVYLFASLGIVLFRNELMVLLGDVAYWKAAEIVPYIAFAYLFWAGSLILDSGFYITKKTIYKPILFGISAAVAMGLCFLLIPHLNYFGAVHATIISFACYFILSLGVLNRIYPITYQWDRLAKLVAVSGLIIFANEILIGGKPVTALLVIDWKTVTLWMVLKMVLLLAYPLILLLTGFFTSEEKTKLSYFARKVLLGKS